MSVESINSNVVTGSSLIYDTENTHELSSEDYLLLMLQELQYQDPLEPQDSEQMMTQLSQLNVVDQLGSVNDNLALLQMYESAVNNTLAISLVGKAVEVNVDGFQYEGNGSQDFYYNVPEGLDSITIKITDEDGNIINSYDVPADTIGKQTFTWDGLDENGNQVEEGQYFIQVEGTINPEDANSEEEPQTVNLGASMRVKIDSILFKDGQIIAKAGNQEIPIENISEVFSNTGTGF
jgi:flagellar basal-body rod modification protein FlgD